MIAQAFNEQRMEQVFNLFLKIQDKLKKNQNQIDPHTDLEGMPKGSGASVKSIVSYFKIFQIYI